MGMKAYGTTRGDAIDDGDLRVCSRNIGKHQGHRSLGKKAHERVHKRRARAMGKKLCK